MKQASAAPETETRVLIVGVRKICEMGKWYRRDDEYRGKDDPAALETNLTVDDEAIEDGD